ncbi:MAG: hypothetical protein K1Y02_05455 [Candidatus Hydrogenedentes bacterium]|nr:hypothetical protein [Candidatus Hydrogenedentota bacterium]
MGSWLGRWTTLFACVLVAYPALSESASTDLVGRKGKVQVIERDGTVENIDPNDLRINTVREKSAAPSPSKATPADEEAKSEAQPAEGESKDAQDSTKQTDGKQKDAKQADPKQATPKKKELTPEQIAAQKKDAEAVRKMLDTGGAYFYKNDNTPLSYDEVKKMVDSNNVEGIKALDLWQQPWKPSFTSGTEDTKTATSGSNPSPKEQK